MSIYLHNTLAKSKELFEPIDSSNVRMYVCGPTVYDRAHIGNARAVVVFDLLYRLLVHAYGKDHVQYVRNITDVDDKINAAAKDRDIEISELTEATTQMFHEDMGALNCKSPTQEPRATAHIDEMVAMIGQLIEGGHAYEAEGHVLFEVGSFDDYGALSNRSHDEMIAGARVEVAPFKKDPADFVLWKPSTEEEPGWKSPWGRGRPGWHLECSAMSSKYLGQTFDIHGGGADLKFPHHENEIAQSRCANKESKFAKYWVHNGFLSVEGEKMSKSLGNFITVHDLLEKGVKGEVIRYALLATHYRKPLDWSEKALSDATKAMNGFYKSLNVLEDKDASAPEAFVEALRDDLNTPKALSVLHELATQVNKTSGDEQQVHAAMLKDAANMLGLLQVSVEQWFGSAEDDPEKEAIEALIAKRKQARDAKNWAESDRIRDELVQMGVVVEDKPDGSSTWSRH